MSDRREFLATGVLGLGAFATGTVIPGQYSGNSPAPISAVRDVLTHVTLKDFEIFKLRFDRKTPLQWNAIKRSGGGYPSVTFLKIITNEGIEGYSMTKGSPGDIARFVDNLKGYNLLQTEQVWESMYRGDRKPVAKGKEIHAIGSVDLCIWDIVGKALGLPVHRVLGTYRTELPVYAAGGYYQEGKGVSELVAECEDYAREGYNVVKIKVAGAPAHEDAERVRAVCKALGPDVRVMIDANNGYRSAYDAIRFGRMVEDLDLFWFEEPVAPDDWRGNREVREELDIPIVAGENEYTRWGARDLVVNHSCDILNLDTIKAGGITEYRKISALASAFHMPVAPHGYTHMNIHVVASTSNALILETYPKKARDFNPALPAYKVTDGHITAPEEPGLGMQPSDELIRKYKV